MSTLSGSTYHVYFDTFEFCKGDWILIAADRYIYNSFHIAVEFAKECLSKDSGISC